MNLPCCTSGEHRRARRTDYPGIGNLVQRVEQCGLLVERHRRDVSKDQRSCARRWWQDERLARLPEADRMAELRPKEIEHARDGPIGPDEEHIRAQTARFGQFRIGCPCRDTLLPEAGPPAGNRRCRCRDVRRFEPPRRACPHRSPPA